MMEGEKGKIKTILPVKIIRDVEGEIGEIVAHISEGTNRDEKQEG